MPFAVLVRPGVVDRVATGSSICMTNPPTNCSDPLVDGREDIVDTLSFLLLVEEALRRDGPSEVSPVPLDGRRAPLLEVLS